MKSIFIHFKKSGTLFLGITLLLFQSCKDDEENKPEYTITGHLYEDCSMQPVVNLTLTLFQDSNNPMSGSNTKGGELATSTTDNNGYFKFVFKDNDGLELLIRYPAGAGYNHVIDNIPQRKSIDGLILYDIPTTNI